MWSYSHAALKHNEADFSSRDTAYPVVQTNTGLGSVSEGAKVALMSTMVSELWITLFNRNETRATAKRVDDMIYLLKQTHTNTHTLSSEHE